MMQIPSPFYVWLGEQSGRADDIGRLATLALADEGWPRGETAKEPLRAYLRQHGGKAFVPALAMALKEFDQVAEEDTSQGDIDYEESLPANRVQLLVPAFLAWAELGFPSREDVTKLAEEGNAAALAIFGLRAFFGVKAPLNYRFGEKVLAEALDKGFAPAALILHDYHLLRMEFEQAQAWRDRGARLGERECVALVKASAEVDRALGKTPESSSFSEAEIDELGRRYLPEDGEVEWQAAFKFALEQDIPRSLAAFEAAAQKGRLTAYSDAMGLLQGLGRISEAVDMLARGAAAGDPVSRGLLAQDKLASAVKHNITLLPEESAGYVRDMEHAMEHGIVALFLPMARRYATGDGIPANPKMAGILQILAVLAAQTDEERAEASIAWEWSTPEIENTSMQAAEEWLYTNAAQKRTRGLCTLAADTWLVTGMRSFR